MGKLLHLGCGGRQYRHRLFTDDGYDEVRLDLVRNDTLSVVADMKSLPFADGRFDAVQSLHSAEHLDASSWDEAMSEVYRVMDSDGLVVVEVPDFESALRWILDGNEREPMYHTGAGFPIFAHDMIYGWQPVVCKSPAMRHLNGFTPRRLYDSFVRAGFVDVTVFRMDEIHQLEAVGRKN